MRNMSFMLTTAQIRRGTKTVTRRLGWWFLKPGDRVMACEKCQGLKKGEKLQRIRPIEVVNARPERLYEVTDEDVKLEGFPGMSAGAFEAMFIEEMRCRPDTKVNRIEFKYV